ncbi:MAG: hypothetical protein CL607_15180 [Anaerolineaceae bacterium]|nr:hypothetical protein [Anaerolineaceae bacterium]
MARWPQSARQIMAIICVVILALLTTFTLTAQDDAQRLVGSGIALPLLEDLATAAEQSLNVEVTGTDAGFQQFCAGEASMVASIRAINSMEDTLCAENGISYIELLVANDVAAAIVKEDDAMPTCLTTAELDIMLAPSATGSVMDWSTFVEVNADASEEATPAPELSVYLPEMMTRQYAIADAFVSGDGFRADATLTSEDEIVAAVSETTGALGLVSLPVAQAAEGVRVLQLNDLTAGTGCYTPTAEAFEASNYTLGTPVLLYVEASAQDASEGFLTTLTADNETVATSDEFVAISENAMAINASVLAGETTDGRQFTTAETTFAIPAALSGEIAVGGTGVGYDYVNNALSQLTAAQPELSVQYQIEGNDAGVRRLCNGEVDFILASVGLTDEQAAACDANEIVPVTIPMGTRAAVLVSNANDDFAACLTTEDITTLWSVNAEGENISNWSTLPGDFPDQDVTLFAPSLGNVYGDLLVESAQPIPPLRDDANVFADTLYRAAATANVEGGITYMGWTDYQRVVNNGQTGIQLVAVDAGSGCVTPSEATIEDSSYPLTESAQLIVAQSSLANVNVQSAIWTLFDDANAAMLQGSGLVGINLNQLPSIRQDLERQFVEASEMAAAPATDTSDEAVSDETDEASTEEGATDDEQSSDEESSDDAEANTADDATTEEATETSSE